MINITKLTATVWQPVPDTTELQQSSITTLNYTVCPDRELTRQTLRVAINLGNITNLKFKPHKNTKIALKVKAGGRMSPKSNYSYGSP